MIDRKEEKVFEDKEFAGRTAAGLRRISLGVRPLRVESAIPALLGRLF